MVIDFWDFFILGWSLVKGMQKSLVPIGHQQISYWLGNGKNYGHYLVKWVGYQPKMAEIYEKKVYLVNFYRAIS